MPKQHVAAKVADKRIKRPGDRRQLYAAGEVAFSLAWVYSYLHVVRRTRVERAESVFCPVRPTC